MYPLIFDHVTKRYGHDVVVDDLSLAVEPGRVTGFLGPNGAGESTTMKILFVTSGVAADVATPAALAGLAAWEAVPALIGVLVLRPRDVG